MAIQYENPPIREALIDIRVALPTRVTLSVLESVHDQVKDRYPGKKRSFHLEGQLSGGDLVGATAKQTPMGFSFISDDGKQVFQARRDGFTFSRLRPYANWIELRTESRRLWEIYRSVATPHEISRVAVRYINQVDIPLNSDYKDYFRTSPEVSPDLQQALSGFFMQLQFPQADFGGTLILNQTTVPPLSPDTHSVVLDLDVFKEPAGMQSDDEVWALLEALRNRKNEFFEGCITDKTRELFGLRKEY